MEELILIGYYTAGSQLPTVKQLGLELGINPNTIQRAYTELEQRGTIESIKGKGCFVSAKISEVITRKQKDMLAEFAKSAEKLIDMGISADEIIECINIIKDKRQEAVK